MGLGPFPVWGNARIVQKRIVWGVSSAGFEPLGMMWACSCCGKWCCVSLNFKSVAGAPFVDLLCALRLFYFFALHAACITKQARSLPGERMQILIFSGSDAEQSLRVTHHRHRLQEWASAGIRTMTMTLREVPHLSKEGLALEARV